MASILARSMPSIPALSAADTISAEADAEAAEEAPEAEAEANADAASLPLPLSVILEPRLLTSMCLWNEHTIGISYW